MYFIVSRRSVASYVDYKRYGANQREKPSEHPLLRPLIIQTYRERSNTNKVSCAIEKSYVGVKQREA